MANKEPSRHAQRMLAFHTLYTQEFLSCSTLEQLQQIFLAQYKLLDEVIQSSSTLEQLQQIFLTVPHQGDSAEIEASGFAWELVQGVWEHRGELDGIIEKYACNWRLDRVGRVELNLLRLGVYELLYRADVPPRASMNDALDLDKQYGDPGSRGFVKGILDTVHKALDKGELGVR